MWILINKLFIDIAILNKQDTVNYFSNETPVWNKNWTSGMVVNYQKIHAAL